MHRKTLAVPGIGLELPSANSTVASVGLSVSLPTSSAFLELSWQTFRSPEGQGHPAALSDPQTAWLKAGQRQQQEQLAS